jgi:hypothetical protein
LLFSTTITTILEVVALAALRGKLESVCPGLQDFRGYCTRLDLTCLA